MKTFFTAFGGAIIGTILGAVLLAFLAAAMIGGFVNSQLSSFQSDGSASGNTVLTLDLRDELSDQPATQGLGAIFGQKGFESWQIRRGLISGYICGWPVSASRGRRC